MPDLTAVLADRKAWSKRRTRSIDRRTRGARRWAELRAELEREMGRRPTPADMALLDLTTDVALAAEVVRARLTAGRVDVDEAIRIASELRRLRRALRLEDGSAQDDGETERQRLEDSEAGLA